MEHTVQKATVLGIVLVLIFGLAPLAVGAPSELRYVVIITIDGCRPDKLQEANTPNIDALIAQGAAYSWSAQTVYPSKTPQAHASLFTGAKPETHGFYSPGDDLKAETIFQVFENLGMRTLLFDSKGGRINGLQADVAVVRNTKDYRWIGPSWQRGSEDPEANLRVMEDALEDFMEGWITLMFVLLPQTDTMGHLYGHTSEQYLKAIETADQAIGMLVDNLRARGWLDETLIVITADHGMTGTDHGTDDPGDMTIPLIFFGPNVPPGEFGNGEIIDVAPTISALFGVRPPADSEGRILFEGREPAGEIPTVAVAGVTVAAAIIIVIALRRRL